MAGFHALVSRDFSQVEQAEEMVVLSRLTDFHVISWKQRMDDPIAEWGQLLAYLPSTLSTTSVTAQVRRDAAAHVASWERDVAEAPGQYTDLLRLRQT